MRPLSRGHTNKARSAAKFRHHVGRAKAVNLAPPPNRGGYRF